MGGMAKVPGTSLPLDAGISVKATCGRDGTYSFLRLQHLQSPHRAKTEWTGPVTGERKEPVTGEYSLGTLRSRLTLALCPWEQRQEGWNENI